LIRRFKEFALLALVSAPAGCGHRAELLGVVAGADGGPLSDGGSTDGALFTPPHFGPPQLVTALSSMSSAEEDPSFTGDLVELFFTSNREGTKDIWTSHRASAADPWGAPSIVTELNTATSADYSPGISVDGLHIWFASDRGTTHGEIWQSSRPNRTSLWSPPSPVTELISGAIDYGPAVDTSETLMFYSSNRPGSTGFDLYSATRPSTAALWHPVGLIPGVNTFKDEVDPFVAQAGLAIFFTSTVFGMGDIFWTARHSIDVPFQTPMPITEVNSSFLDSDPSLSPALDYMMFSSTRSGNAEIYETHALK
jgi:hypothetical protein